MSLLPSLGEGWREGVGKAGETRLLMLEGGVKGGLDEVINAGGRSEGWEG